MKIFNNSNIQKVLGAYQSKMTKTQKNSKVSEAKDKIEISSNARDFQVAINAFKKLSELREEKVTETQRAIASGTYNPSSEETLDRMLEGINFDKKI